ncbi:hypothetical protein BGX29_008393 [Mortierella sp. GBA35]|nr:hypothetical protein BGX29_008393 [Mortierella sp. GBA35]
MVASLEDHDHHHNKQLAFRQRIQYYRLFWFKRDLKGVFLTVLSTFALYLLATQFHFFIAHDSSSTSITATTATSISSTPLDSAPLGDNRNELIVSGRIKTAAGQSEAGGQTAKGDNVEIEQQQQGQEQEQIVDGGGVEEGQVVVVENEEVKVVEMDEGA